MEANADLVIIDSADENVRKDIVFEHLEVLIDLITKQNLKITDPHRLSLLNASQLAKKKNKNKKIKK